MAGGQSIELVSITSIPHLQWLDGQLLCRAFLVPFQTVSARQSSKSKKEGVHWTECRPGSCFSHLASSECKLNRTCHFSMGQARFEGNKPIYLSATRTYLVACRQPFTVNTALGHRHGYGLGGQLLGPCLNNG